MTALGDYRLQTILAVLQSLAVICGALIFRTMIKAAYPAMALHDTMTGIFGFLFDSSAFLLLIPLAWVIFTIRKEKNSRSSWTAKHTLISGMILIAAILATFVLCTNIATHALQTIQPLG